MSTSEKTSSEAAGSADRAPAPALSVIVPCRNERVAVEGTLRSILAQSLAADQFEVIVVDGQSDDGTRDILRFLQAEFPLLIVLDNPDRITATAMNLGIEASRGDYIAILGAHTTYASDYLESCLTLLAEHPEADCVGGPIESRGRSAFGRAVAAAMSHPAGVGNARHRFPRFEGYAEGACFPVFRRHVFDRLGGYDPNLVRNQDDDFNFRLRQSGGRVYISPRARSTYFVRESTRELFHQYYQYGYWRLAVLRKHGQPASWRQLVPAVFYLVLMTACVASLFAPAAWRTALLLPAVLYLILLLGTGLTLWPRVGTRAALWLPWTIVVMHAAYAAGFTSALARRGAASPSGNPRD